MSPLKSLSAASDAFAAPYRGLALARWFMAGRHTGFIVFVNGEVLREKRHFNERVFETQDFAIKAGQRARRK